MLLVVTAMLFGTGLIAIGKFSDAINDNTGVNTTAEQAISSLTTSVSNFSVMFPTIGTILGVAVLIIAVLGAFSWFGGFGAVGKAGKSSAAR